MNYFDDMESAFTKWNNRTESVLTAISNRFIGLHPKHPPVYRTICKDGFLREKDYRYEINLDEKLPGLQAGQLVYVWSKLWSEQEQEVPFSLSCYSPVRVFIQGEAQFQSNLNDDVFPDRKTGFRAKVQKGWNHIVLEFVKTGTGCGGKFGTGSIKGFPLHVLAPSADRSGQEGWIYSEPLQEAWPSIPREEIAEVDTGIRWYPNVSWSETERNAGVFTRLYGTPVSQHAYAWAKLACNHGLEQKFKLRGTHQGPISIFVNGTKVFATIETEGRFEISLLPSYGSQHVIVQSTCSGVRWGVDWEDIPEQSGFKWTKPYPVEGLQDPWLYLGPFKYESSDQVDHIPFMDKVFQKEDGGIYWRADLRNTWIRPYLENPMYGRWNYPLGVTLYGLLQTGKELNITHYTNYVTDHIEQITSLDAYALWDVEQYGAPAVNHQLTSIDSLDDCGSFGATMLVAMEERMLQGAEVAANRIAHYISHVQDRRKDGALYRVQGSVDFMQDTMWCDDLYMSTPFLCRYFKLTGEELYITDAVRQFLLYKQYLYMPEHQIMSHVYDFKFHRQNDVPWGRGNGWVLFSLTEVLALLPEGHELREEALNLFRELCEGYLQLQGDNGLWHQVLTDPQSYEETSCTSMFIYAFARGIRYGWLLQPEAYIQAVWKGWEGLTRISIDKHGNIFGVCRGSGYSFSSRYYKEQLSWQLNDTHGIGIVLLAGIETIKLSKYLGRD
ncbi:glycoside hydrolase family 105 protein [Paenibacillus sp. V4I7]|uniref:glycoside hydrolase family 88/105 protein n=2 Tax=unclassified Paenibacillus TaxID=185978 RepID=UPI00278876E7|nr:glycoside hydrolase family 88 protein [Paenibacillus sp. V4I7]MDQ0896874.1 unsaturated rhamnogalacturonyl hydrolase [Paenibacillus sp. V4I7]